MVRLVFMRSITFSAKRLKVSSLLPSTLKKPFQSEGILARTFSPSAIPPLLPCAPLQRVFMVNVPYNVYSLDCFQRYCDLRGKNIIKVIFKGLSCGFNIWTKTAPLTMAAWIVGCVVHLLFGKHLLKSAFCPLLSWPVSDSKGGQGWFSNL